MNLSKYFLEDQARWSIYIFDNVEPEYRDGYGIPKKFVTAPYQPN